MAESFCENFFHPKYVNKVLLTQIFILCLLYLVPCVVNAECKPEECVNGACVADECQCSPGWKGPLCNFCGGRLRLTSLEGSITDGPGNYTENNQCSWLIDSGSISSSHFDPGHDHRKVIRLHVSHFATECSWDHLYIYDGDSVYAPLLAVYSGLVVSDGYSSVISPEVVTTSGFALIHFYSDAAYNLTGFDIKYRIGGCPGGASSSGGWTECSSNGRCEDGVCRCDEEYAGVACERLRCPHHCSNNGKCNTLEGRCDCYEHFTGSDCSQSGKNLHWRAGHFQPYKVPSTQSYFKNLSHHHHNRRETRPSSGEDSYDLLRLGKLLAHPTASKHNWRHWSNRLHTQSLVKSRPEHKRSFSSTRNHKRVPREVVEDQLETKQEDDHSEEFHPKFGFQYNSLNEFDGFNERDFGIIFPSSDAYQPQEETFKFEDRYDNLVERDDPINSDVHFRPPLMYPTVWWLSNLHHFLHPKDEYRLHSDKDRSKRSLTNAEDFLSTSLNDRLADNLADSSNDAVFSSEVYDISHPLLARSSMASVAVDGIVYVLGGYSFSQLPFVVRYNVSSGEVKAIEAASKLKPSDRHGHVAVNFNNSIYMFGGMLRSGVVTAELWKFSLDSFRWQMLWAPRKQESGQSKRDENSNDEEVSVEMTDERQIRKNSWMKAVGERTNEPHKRWFSSNPPEITRTRRKRMSQTAETKESSERDSDYSILTDDSLFADSPNSITDRGLEGMGGYSPQCRRRDGLCAPIAVVGAGAIFLPSGNFPNTDPVMLVFYGYSPVYGFVNLVQEYHFVSNTWRIVDHIGAILEGRYGHSVVWDAASKKVLIHGGLISSSTTSTVVNHMIAYDPQKQAFYKLPPAPSSLYLHSAVSLSPGGLVVFGGNSHNDTSFSHSAICYTNSALFYDSVCGTWHSISQPNAKDLGINLARYGHSSVVLSLDGERVSMVSLGGFNGQMLSSSLILTPGHCKYYSEKKCLESYPGVKCVWNINLVECQVYDVNKYSRDDYLTCPGELHDRTAKSRSDVFPFYQASSSLCNSVTDCLSCFFTSSLCSWCDNKCQDSCPTSRYNTVAKSSDCPLESTLPQQCKVLNSCQQCHRSDVLLENIFPRKIESLNSCHWHNSIHCRYDNSSVATASGDETTAVPRETEYSRHPWVPLRNSSESKASSASVGLPVHGAPVKHCRAPCHLSTTCANCTMSHCMWCVNEKRCVDNNSYLASFPYGTCQEWVTVTRSCMKIDQDSDTCSHKRSCTSCHSSVGCGWCDDGSGTGMGACIAGGAGGARHHISGDLNKALCPLQRWYFTSCPACNCNGHSYCKGVEGSNGAINNLHEMSKGATGDIEPLLCHLPCANNTDGNQCQYCKPTYYGSAINGGLCKPCNCNGHGTHCDRDNGRCYCSTKGVTGDHCQRCDTQHSYFGNPLNASCFYDLQVDYQFTFNLSKAEDRYVRQINFFNVPSKPDVDTDFDITCSKPARIKISAKETGGSEVWVVRNYSGKHLQKKFSHTDFIFGTPDNNTTFHVYVYNFTPPVEIVVSFSQYMKLNLLGFFYIFLLCFLCLLVVAAIVYKIKQKYDIYIRRQRLMVEMEAMASRPFKPIFLELQKTSSVENASYVAVAPAANGGKKVKKKRQKEATPQSHLSAASPIALEICEGEKGAVLSMFVQLPTGGSPYMPYLHPGGLAVASTLVSLGGSQQKASLSLHAAGGDKIRRNSRSPPVSKSNNNSIQNNIPPQQVAPPPPQQVTGRTSNTNHREADGVSVASHSLAVDKTSTSHLCNDSPSEAPTLTNGTASTSDSSDEEIPAASVVRPDNVSVTTSLDHSNRRGVSTHPSSVTVGNGSQFATCI